MKAAVIEKPGKLVVKEVPSPKVGDYDALCEMLYGAVCSGTDSHLLQGVFPKPVKYPTILGHESIGRVIEVGKKVRNFKVGDLVTRVGTTAPEGYHINWGGFAEYGIAKDHWAMREDGIQKEEWNRNRVNQIIPADFDPIACPMIITWRETLSYTTRLGVGPGAKALVIGSGGNGLSFAAHAKNLGAKMVAMVGSIRRAEAASQAGVTDYFDYKSEELLEQVIKSAADGFDFIIDAVGKNGQLNNLLPSLKPGGIIGIYGWDDFFGNSIIPNRSRGTFTYYNGGYDEEETHERVIDFIRKGCLKAEIWTDLEHPIPLSNINQAFDKSQNRNRIKALIKLSKEL